MPEIISNSVIRLGSKPNCAFSWGRPGTAQVLQAYCRGVAHGFDVIAEESHARQTRAFYPRQVAERPFAVTLDLKGYAAYKIAMDYFRKYSESFMVAANNAMYVIVPSRNFVRLGVPVSGVSDGDRVGSAEFLSSIVFESVYDPADPDLVSKNSNTSRYSRFDPSTSAADRPAEFFYPAAASTNDPNASGDLLYDSEIGGIGAGIEDILNPPGRPSVGWLDF